MPGEGQVGLITYMRTDSTHLSGEALNERARLRRLGTFGGDYLPAKPNFFGSSNKAAQEAHEAIRPTDVRRTPESLRGALPDDQWKLYRLIWNRFVACQMTPAKWDATTVLLERSDRATGADSQDDRAACSPLTASTASPACPPPATSRPYRTSARATRLRRSTSRAIRSSPARRRATRRRRSSRRSKPRASVGPRTYASIIKVIQNRQYVEQIDRRFHATDLGEVVTDKLLQGFPRIMDLGYTRDMEAELDKIAEQHQDWVEMLERFYARFRESLDTAHEQMTHAKAEMQPAPYACPECGQSHRVPLRQERAFSLLLQLPRL